MVSSQLCKEVIFLTYGLCTFSQEGPSGPWRIIFPSTICWAGSAFHQGLSIMPSTEMTLGHHQLLSLRVIQGLQEPLKRTAHRTTVHDALGNRGQTIRLKREALSRQGRSRLTNKQKS